MRLRGALIGFGQVAQNAHVPAFHSSEDVEIVAVADTAPALRAQAAQAFPGAKTYASLKDLLAGEKRLDFVDLATPPWLHGAQALEALEQDLHVLCEKPLTLDVSQLRQLAQSAARREKTVFTVHNWAYAPIWAKAQELLAQGAIGEPRHAELHVLRTKPAPGQQGDWRMDRRLAGGGILVDHGWHNLYLLRRCLFPAGAAQSPLLTSAVLHRPMPTGAEDEATVFFQFSQATALVRLSWRASSRSNTALIQGSTGTLELRDDRILLSSVGKPEQAFSFPQKLSAGSAHPEWFSAMLPDFLAEIRDHRQRGRNLAEAGFVLDLITRAYAVPTPAQPLEQMAA